VRWNPGKDQLAHLFAATVAFEPPPVAKSGLDVRLRSAAWLSTARSRHSNAHGRQNNLNKDQEATCEHPCRARISCKRWWSGKTARWPCDAPGPEAGGRRRTYVRTSTGAVTAAVMRSSATCNPRASLSAEPSSGIPPLRQTSVAHIADGFALWSSSKFPLDKPPFWTQRKTRSLHRSAEGQTRVNDLPSEMSLWSWFSSERWGKLQMGALVSFPNQTRGLLAGLHRHLLGSKPFDMVCAMHSESTA
jgi:hypothetical protein